MTCFTSEDRFPRGRLGACSHGCLTNRPIPIPAFLLAFSALSADGNSPLSGGNHHSALFLVTLRARNYDKFFGCNDPADGDWKSASEADSFLGGQMRTLTYACALALLVAGSTFGSELGDSMQVYFSGDYQRAHQMLSDLIAKGHVDARTHYFRGLANRRMGKLEDAVSDFNKGAELELAGAGYGVGDSLQRVQGMDRLILERHRSMARLKTRRRIQPVAPRPIPKAPVVNQIQLATATTPVSSEVPLFRLASEIPMRDTTNDPIANQPSDMLARERMPSGPDATAIAETDPVGTGVAREGSSSVSASTPASSRRTVTDREPQPGKLFGAVFRAFRAPFLAVRRTKRKRQPLIPQTIRLERTVAKTRSGTRAVKTRSGTRATTRLAISDRSLVPFFRQGSFSTNHLAPATAGAFLFVRWFRDRTLRWHGGWTSLAEDANPA